MADQSKYIQAQKFSLAVGISTTDTSITLQSFKFPDGTAITSSDLGSVNYGTLEPGTSREEQISFTGITVNSDETVTLTGVTRGLGFGAVDTYSEQSDLKVQHGAGATFIISNTAAFYDRFVNKFNDETIEGTLSAPTPTSNSHVATKEYVDSTAFGGSLTQDRVVQAGIAGQSVGEGDLLYFDDTDNEWKKTAGTTAATLNNVLLGIAQGAGSDGGSIDGGVLTYGLDSNQSGLTPGVKLYAGDAVGTISESAGTVERVIGWSKSATEIYFDANAEYIPTANEKDAMAGGGDFGTPSSTNKFLTEESVVNNDVFKPIQIVTFTSSGTWTKDAGLKYIVVEGVGGGGGGGYDNSSLGAAGGGGGAYFKKLILSSDLSETETVTVGAEGIGGSSSTPNGGDGGNTSFGSFATAGGGNGGPTNSVSNVDGGTATGGDININGGQGGGAFSDGSSTSTHFGGNGGSSILGFGGFGFESRTAPQGYGAGGPGGGENSGSSGTSGTAGIVIVTEYYS